MKRSIRFFMPAALLLLLAALFVLPVMGADRIEGDFAYEISGGEARIKSYSGLETWVTIPETLGGYRVTGISDNAFKDSTVIMRLTVSDNVVTIGKSAFQNCSRLYYLALGSGLKTIGDRAFQNCGKLSTAYIPENVTTIGDYAFSGCSGLETAYMEGWDKKVPYQTIGSHAFYNDTALVTIQIGYGVKNIGSHAFSGLTNSDKHFYYQGSETEFAEIVIGDGNVIAPIEYNTSMFIRPDPAFAPILFIENPADQILPIGSTAEFDVLLMGTAPISYLWQYSKDSGKTWSDCPFSTAKTGVLKVSVADYRDGYLFRCVASDCSGNTIISRPASLIVATEITRQPSSVNNAVGETATFTVEASGVEPFKYQWQCSTDGGTTWKNSGFSTARSETLKVPVAAGRDGYKYRCRVEGFNGQYKYSGGATLNVLTKITSQPAAAKKAIGETASFTVKAEGVNLKYQWQCSADAGKTWKDSGFSTAKSATLKVPVTAARDGFRYRCKVTGTYGKVISNAASLIVTVNITTQPSSLKKSPGATANFTVKATGVRLAYLWQTSTDGGTTWKNSGFDTAGTATLKVPVTKARNGYRYRCVVIGSNGQTAVSSAAKLTVS